MGDRFGKEVGRLSIPATKFFRICDLLHGNDVRRLLDAVALALSEAKIYEANHSIEFSKFVKGIREPIPLHPGLDYVATERYEGGRAIERFGIVLDTEMEFSMSDLKRQIREFLYQFSVMLRSPSTLSCIRMVFQVKSISVHTSQAISSRRAPVNSAICR